jgi:uncharacterized coiled-coil protein SlyX
MASHEPSAPEAVSRRLARLEESQAFAERAAEQLSAEMAEINRRLGEVAARLARLEGKVHADTGEERDESPRE